MAEASSSVNNGVNVAALIEARELLPKLLLLRSLSGAPLANGRMALTLTLRSKVFTASGKNSITRKLLHSMLTTRKFSPPRTKVPRRSSTS